MRFGVILNNDGSVLVTSRPSGDGDRSYFRHVVRPDKDGMAMGMPFSELASLSGFVTSDDGKIISKKKRNPPYDGELPTWAINQP